MLGTMIRLRPEHIALRAVAGRFTGEPRGTRIAPGGEPGAFAAALETFQEAVRAFARVTAGEPA
jgi:hypothetical protein